MSLYKVEFTPNDIDEELVIRIQAQSDMNRAIQENLKP